MRLRLHAGRFFGLLLTVAQSQDFTYTNINGAITITTYNGPGGNVTIPDTIAGLPVTRIGTNAFFNKISLAQVAMGNSVSAIGDYAFANWPQRSRRFRQDFMLRAGSLSGTVKQKATPYR